MRKASSELLEQGIQAPSPAPDLIPAKSSTENLHSGWYSKRGHFSIYQTRFAVAHFSRSDPTCRIFLSSPDNPAFPVRTVIWKQDSIGRHAKSDAAL